MRPALIFTSGVDQVTPTLRVSSRCCTHVSVLWFRSRVHPWLSYRDSATRVLPVARCPSLLLSLSPSFWVCGLVDQQGSGRWPQQDTCSESTDFHGPPNPFPSPWVPGTHSCCRNPHTALSSSFRDTPLLGRGVTQAGRERRAFQTTNITENHDQMLTSMHWNSLNCRPYMHNERPPMFVFGAFWNLNGPLPVKSLSTAEGNGTPTEPACPWRKLPTPRPVLQRYVKTAQKSCQAAFHKRDSASQCHACALWVPKGRSQKCPPQPSLNSQQAHASVCGRRSY